jgi:hypothetical protein
VRGGTLPVKALEVRLIIQRLAFAGATGTVVSDIRGRSRARMT